MLIQIYGASTFWTRGRFTVEAAGRVVGDTAGWSASADGAARTRSGAAIAARAAERAIPASISCTPSTGTRAISSEENQTKLTVASLQQSVHLRDRGNAAGSVSSFHRRASLRFRLRSSSTQRSDGDDRCGNVRAAVLAGQFIAAVAMLLRPLYFLAGVLVLVGVEAGFFLAVSAGVHIAPSAGAALAGVEEGGSAGG